MNSWSSPLGGSAKTATRVAMPLCTRSAASSAPAPPIPGTMTMMSELEAAVSRVTRTYLKIVDCCRSDINVE